jgi:DNA-binding transcriptional ArsR family regulator
MKLQTPSSADHLTQTFAALADPTRRLMLARLAKGQANVSDLAKPFLDEMSLPAVTKHLQVLERAGLITKTREAQFRPCRLNGNAFKDAFNWIEHYRQFWEESFDRLEEYLKTVTGKTAGAAKQTNAAKKTEITTILKKTTTTAHKSKGKKYGRKK